MTMTDELGVEDDGLTAAVEPQGAWQTFVRGVRTSPEFVSGIWTTLALAVVATAGRVVIPVAVQQTIDHGVLRTSGPDVGYVERVVAVTAVAVAVTAFCAYRMNLRLYRTTEAGLATLRIKAFRHVHDLSMLHQQTQSRGSLVSRVTSDVDQISTFMQWGGIIVIVSVGQMLVATVLMLVWSWQLSLVVFACFVPLLLAMRVFQRWISHAYDAVRARVGDMLGVVAETVVGAEVIRAYGVEERTATRIDAAVAAHRDSSVRAQRIVALTFSTGEIAAGLATAGCVALGVLLGVQGHLTAGKVVGFLFVVTLFVQPVQTAAEMLGEAQNAVAGWRRVLGVLDMPADVADPGASGETLPGGPIAVRFDGVGFAYPGGPTVLHDLDIEIAPRTRIAVVGETGSGKTTFAKLVTRLMDPVSGVVSVNGVDLRAVSFEVLRKRIVMVPQDGFLFDASLADNIRYGFSGEMTDGEVEAVLSELGLGDWLDTLPAGLQTPVGERGESLSAGERQLVALARAFVAEPDLLVLDEATSAVDPATDVRLQRALDGVSRGRTSITIAHRLSTAESADDVLVFDAGRLVERGRHFELIELGGTYARLHASWRGATGS
jgi:putative ABC transport system ATP-binding protein